MRIIETDNFGGDYPAEIFLNLPVLRREDAEFLCRAINLVCAGPDRPRFWKVVENNYIPQTGFEP